MEHEDITREADAQAEQLKQQGDQLEGRIDSARQDWASKQADPSVPGAVGDPDSGGERQGEPGGGERQDEPGERDDGAPGEGEPGERDDGNSQPGGRSQPTGDFTDEDPGARDAAGQ